MRQIRQVSRCCSDFSPTESLLSPSSSQPSCPPQSWPCASWSSKVTPKVIETRSTAQLPSQSPSVFRDTSAEPECLSRLSDLGSLSVTLWQILRNPTSVVRSLLASARVDHQRNRPIV